MIERLLLDGIDAKAARPAPRGEDHGIVLASAYEAEAALALVQAAGPGTDIALHAAVVELVEVAPDVAQAEGSRKANAP